MAETAAERAVAVQKTADATKELDPAAQVAAIEGVVPGPDAETTKMLWIILVGGLVVALLVALVGLIVVDEETTDVALTAFTALLTGLIGLFSPSPVKAGGKSK